MFKCFQQLRVGSKRGYSLVEMAVVVSILSLLVSGGLSVLSKKEVAKSEAAVEDRMEKVLQAIERFVQIKGYIPCPAPDVLESHANFGKSSTYDAATALCGTETGRVPVRTLGILDTYAYDAWGFEFTYRVSKGLSSAADFNKAKYLGDLSVVDLEGREKTSLDSFGHLKQGAAFVLISHGSNAYGAGIRNSASASPNNPTNIEGDNIDHTSNKRYIQDETTDVFDDILEFRKKYDLMPPKNSEAPILISKMTCDNAREVVKTDGPKTSAPTNDLGDFANANVSYPTIATQIYDSAVLMETICDSAPDAPDLYSTLPVTAGLSVWLDAADISTIQGGVNVTQWGDKSGNSNHALITANPTLQPTSVPAAINGNNVIRFNNDKMYINALASALGMVNSDFEVFVVAKTANTAIQFLFAMSVVGDKELHINGAAGLRFIPRSGVADYSDIGANSAYDDGTPRIFSARISDGSGISRVNGTDTTDVSNAGVSPNDGYVYIGIRGNDTYPLYGDVGEIVIYNRALTDSERYEVEEYLSQKWGVAIP